MRLKGERGEECASFCMHVYAEGNVCAEAASGGPLLHKWIELGYNETMGLPPSSDFTPLISCGHRGRWGIVFHRGDSWDGRLWLCHTPSLHSIDRHLQACGSHRDKASIRSNRVCISVSQTSEPLLSTLGFHRDRDRQHSGRREHDERQGRPTQQMRGQEMKTSHKKKEWVK